jgi:uncharacterized C2H2 Zn-finger protein
MNCSACQGTGKIPDKVIDECAVCNGTAILASPQTLVVSPCPHCGATGKVEKLYIENRVILCNRCRGMGMIRRHGGAFISCPKCDGMGKYFMALTGANVAQMFDPQYYVSMYDDLAGYSPQMALNHYMTIGAKEGRSLNVFFHPQYIYELYAHLREHIADDERRHLKVLIYWLKFGTLLGLQGSPIFDVKYYVSANSDIGDILLGTGYPQYANAYEHWVKIGVYENRKTSEFLKTNLLKVDGQLISINPELPEYQANRIRPLINSFNKMITLRDFEDYLRFLYEAEYYNERGYILMYDRLFEPRPVGPPDPLSPEQRAEYNEVHQSLRDYNPRDPEHVIVRDNGEGDLLGRDPSEPIV